MIFTRMALQDNPYNKRTMARPTTKAASIGQVLLRSALIASLPRQVVTTGR